MRPWQPQTVARAVAYAAVVLGTLELTIRVDDWSQFDVPLNSPYIGLAELAVRDSLGVHPRASAQFRQFRINALGFRGPEAPTALPKTLIITAGASETFGLYERAGQEWPRQLEDSLSMACQSRVTVLNAAFAGMSLPTVQQDFELRLRHRQARYVVYYPTPMQYLEAVVPRAAAPSASPDPAPSGWRLRSLPRFREALKRAVPDLLRDRLRAFLTSRNRASTATPVRETVEPLRLEAYDRDLRALVGSYRRAGAQPVLVLHRHRFRETASEDAKRLLRAWERFYPRYTGEAIVAFDDLAAEQTRQVGRDSAVVVVDPLPTLVPLGAAAFADFSHFTDAGAAAVAGAVSRALYPGACR